MSFGSVGSLYWRGVAFSSTRFFSWSRNRILCNIQNLRKQDIQLLQISS